MKHIKYALCVGLAVVVSTIVSTATASAVEHTTNCIVETVGDIKVGAPHKLTIKRGELPTGFTEEKLKLSLVSSGEGVFLEDNDSAESIKEAEVNTTDSEYSVYYRPTAPGDHVITVKYPIVDIVYKATCELRVIEATVSDQPDTEPMPVLTLQGDDAVIHVDSINPFTIRGSVDVIPKGYRVMMRLVNSNKEVITEQEVEERGKDIKLTLANLPEAVKNGNYTVELLLYTEDGVVLQEVAAPVEITVAAPAEPEVDEDTADSGNIPDKPLTATDVPPLQPLPPVKDIYLSEDFVAPYKGRVIAQTPTLAAISQRRSIRPDAVAAEISKTVQTEADLEPESYVDIMEKAQPVKLSVPDSQDSTPIENSSPAGLLGLDWYWWGGGLGTVGVLWLGVRKFIK